MEIVLICTVFGVFLCFSFIFGAKLGQTVAQKKEIKMPNLNPVTKVKEIKRNKEDQKELDRLNKIYQNIENYDGTGANQKEV